ncbi:hypothetical protein V3C99_011455, partial [Haemonchus contortus]
SSDVGLSKSITTNVSDRTSPTQYL